MILSTYRIFKTKHAATWFDGEGAYRYGGRWNSKGTRILYTSATLSLATLEIIVNLGTETLLPAYSFAIVEFDDRHVLPIEEFDKLPSNWFKSPPPLAVQEMGDEWASSRSSLVLRVPTAVSTGEYNYLINVEHPDISEVELGTPQGFKIDERLRR